MRHLASAVYLMLFMSPLRVIYVKSSTHFRMTPKKMACEMAMLKFTNRLQVKNIPMNRLSNDKLDVGVGTPFSSIYMKGRN